MESVNAIESPKPERRNLGAERRIRQLTRQKTDLRVQAEYMQSVISQMIPLLPKPTVTRILTEARKYSQPTSRFQQGSKGEQ